MDNNSFLTGSICLSEIPTSQMRKVMCKDGKERIYLNLAVMAKKTPQTFGDRTYTHYITCAPKKEERVEGVNYILGDLETRSFGGSTFTAPTPEQIASAPAVQPGDDLPF